MTNKIGFGIEKGGGEESPSSSHITDYMRAFLREVYTRAAAAGIRHPHCDMQFTTAKNGDIRFTLTCTETSAQKTETFDLNASMVVDPDAVIGR